MNASLTAEAAERAGEETHSLLRSLASESQRAVDAERAAAAARREAEAERGKSARATQAARDAAARADRAEAEAVHLRDEQIAREEALLTELASRDLEYTEALVFANRLGRDAAIAWIEREGRRRDGDLLRSAAAIWLDAADKGEKPARSVLAKWLEAARTIHSARALRCRVADRFQPSENACRTAAYRRRACFGDGCAPAP